MADRAAHLFASAGNSLPVIPPARLSGTSPEDIVEAIARQIVHPGDDSFPWCDPGAGWRVNAALQPIFSLAHNRCVGFEGLARPAFQGQAVAPGHLFSSSADLQSTRDWDRRCRYLHMQTFSRICRNDHWLFFNLNPSIITDVQQAGARVTRAMLQAAGLPPHQMVVEILEKALGDEAALRRVIDCHRELGCLVAIDDFGAGESNFDRIWKLKPDIVKLDGSILAHAAENTRAARILPGMVALLHEVGCLVLLEGIETTEQALLAMDADVDLVQGFLFASPQNDATALATALRQSREHIPGLRARFNDGALQEFRGVMGEISRYLLPFREWSDCGTSGADMALLSDACARLLALPGVRRCFVLNRQGRQEGENRDSPQSALPRQYLPLGQSGDSDWSRRDYFRRALFRPGEVQVTGPYLSLPDARPCVTLSRATEGPQREGLVFCCDLDWQRSARWITGSLGTEPLRAWDTLG
ncbi:MAG: EAL domain-containing protein [Magnetococcus sp. WYHC-3]